MAWVRVRMPVMQAFTGAETGVVFPNHCLYCTEAADASTPVTVSASKSVGRRKYTQTLKLTIPYCRKHQGLDKRIRHLKSGVLVLGLVLTAVPIFVLMFQSSSNPWGKILTILFEAFLGGVVVGVLLLCLLNLIAMIFFQPWRDCPFGLRYGSLGFIPALDMGPGKRRDMTHLVLKFSNPDYADAFVQANPGALKPR